MGQEQREAILISENFSTKKTISFDKFNIGLEFLNEKKMKKIISNYRQCWARPLQNGEEESNLFFPGTQSIDKGNGKLRVDSIKYRKCRFCAGKVWFETSKHLASISH